MTDGIKMSLVIAEETVVGAQSNVLDPDIGFAKEIHCLWRVCVLLIANAKIVVLIGAPDEDFISVKQEEEGELKHLLSVGEIFNSL